MGASRNYCTAAGNAVRLVFEAITMSIILFQQKKLEKLKKELNALEEQKPS